MTTRTTTKMPELESRTTVLGPTSYIRKPASTLTGGERRSPRVVIIFGWYGSTLPTLERYSKRYDELFPSTTQILIRCVATTFLASSAAQRMVLIPVARKIEELLSDDETRNGQSVLVHLFSNGGCFELVTLSDLLRSRPSLHLPTGIPSAIIFDSCPAHYDATAMKRIMALLVPSFPGLPSLDVVSLVVLAALPIAFRRVWTGLGLAESPCAETLATQWDRLHQPDLCPWFTKDTKRLYLYSRGDLIIPHTVVEEHMEDARKNGLDVHQVLFDKSSHISHAKKYPEQYWEAVKRVWDDASMSGRHKL